MNRPFHNMLQVAKRGHLQLETLHETKNDTSTCCISNDQAVWHVLKGQRQSCTHVGNWTAFEVFVCVTRFETGLFQEPGIYIYYIYYIHIFGRNLRPLWKNHKLITFWFHGEKSSGIKVNIAAQRGRVIDLRGFKKLREFSASTFDLKHYQRVDSLLPAPALWARAK